MLVCVCWWHDPTSRHSRSSDKSARTIAWCFVFLEANHAYSERHLLSLLMFLPDKGFDRNYSSLEESSMNIIMTIESPHGIYSCPNRCQYFDSAHISHSNFLVDAIVRLKPDGWEYLSISFYSATLRGDCSWNWSHSPSVNFCWPLYATMSEYRWLSQHSMQIHSRHQKSSSNRQVISHLSEYPGQNNPDNPDNPTWMTRVDLDVLLDNANAMNTVQSFLQQHISYRSQSSN